MVKRIKQTDRKSFKSTVKVRKGGKRFTTEKLRRGEVCKRQGGERERGTSGWLTSNSNVERDGSSPSRVVGHHTDSVATGSGIPVGLNPHVPQSLATDRGAITKLPGVHCGIDPTLGNEDRNEFLVKYTSTIYLHNMGITHIHERDKVTHKFLCEDKGDVLVGEELAIGPSLCRYSQSSRGHYWARHVLDEIL